MAGIYLHIPFCKAKCHYCDFFSLATSRYRDEFRSAILKEIHGRTSFLAGESVETVYFGGGTPSLLGTDHLSAMLDAIRSGFNVSSDAEITLEANPDDLRPEYLMALRRLDINRLSIGVQSFRGSDLTSLNRIHDETQAIQCIRDARSAGFDNLSIDLIYGMPGLDMEGWQYNLDMFQSLGIQHLSAYWLTIEEGTALAGFIRKGKYPSPDEATGAAQFKFLMDWAQGLGYQHYEVSNYALPGYHSRHNTAYWNGTPYLGLGPSAHSFNGINRQWNVSNLSGYIKGIEEDAVVFETEIISGKQRFNEYVMTSLRTRAGCETSRLKEMNEEWAGVSLQQARKYVERGWLKDNEGKLGVIDEGWFHLDSITSDLFLD